ncbi:hypothetical protein C4D60_Mb09t24960 [Musa balbisiana]|uniref:Uncharacterized protein n=1 Tax=Musa balbisiana TaxID=52838 RepID=A0A4S8IIW2_MUSBA|nr:hypothetical protein C4D60_Mb09t24960 [Musa balbisiana]
MPHLSFPRSLTSSTFSSLARTAWLGTARPLSFATSAWLIFLASRARWIACRTSAPTRSSAAGSVVSSSFRAYTAGPAAFLFVPASNFFNRLHGRSDLHRLHGRPGADGLVHGLGILEIDGPGLAPAQHHRLPVLRQNLPVPSLEANEWLMAD